MAKICIVVAKYYPEQPIAKRSAETLFKEGHSVDVICLRKRGEKKEESVCGVSVYRLPIEHHREGMSRYVFEYLLFFILATLKLTQLSIRRRYKVVQVCTLPDFLVFSTVFARLLGSKVILYMFDYMPELFATSFRKGEKHLVVRLLRAVERASIRYAHRVIVVCENQKKRIKEMDHSSNGKVSVVLNVPDDAIFGEEPLNAVAKDNKHFRLITHGNLLKRQGVQTLIQAVPLVVKDIPELEVEVVGDGEYLPELQRLARDLKVDGYVTFTGWIPAESVPYHIARADIGIVAHILDLMLPHKVFEYLALGKPVVAAEHGHMIVHFSRDTVFFYTPGDEQSLARCVVDLYRHPEKRVLLSAHATLFYQKYCRWENIKQNYLKVYGELSN